MSAYIVVVTEESLGKTIRRLRLEADYTLRKFAETVGISAAYQSDIEHGRRVPTDDLLRKIAELLGRRIPVTYEDLRNLSARIEPDLDDMVRQTPEVNQLLRQVKETGRPAGEVIRELQAQLRRMKQESEE